MITEREAARRLAAAGVARRQAVAVLHSGLAGDPVRTSAAVLYDETAVDALLSRPVVALPVLDDLLRSGLFVGRRGVDVRAPLADQFREGGRSWWLTPPTVIWLRARLQRQGVLPFVTTAGGFVLCGGDITDFSGDADGRTDLVLSPPGPWFAGVRGRRLPTGPGRAVLLLGWRPTTARAVREAVLRMGG